LLIGVGLIVKPSQILIKRFDAGCSRIYHPHGRCARPLCRSARSHAAGIERRKNLYFAPYHAALAREVSRLRALYKRVVLYWITRTYGRPAAGVHAVQMELAMRGYLPDEGDAPRWSAYFAKPIQQTLRAVLEVCLAFARA
jgi:N-formylglutamate amidohydrolase